MLYDSGGINVRDEAKKVMGDFDTSRDGKIDEEEFVRGMCRWLDQAKSTVSHSGNYSTAFFNEFHQVTN